jgi:hypothetical protein
MSEVFMCYMEGQNRPKRKQPSLEIAMGEAKRLSELPDCTGRVFVLADVAVFEKPQPQAPVITIKKKRLIVSPE